MSAIVISDLHLNEKPADADRWNLFPWLRKFLKRDDELLILGDLTDAKDRHPARLVNRFVDELLAIVAMRVNVIIIKGNHDYIDEANPFFEFLGQMDQGLTFLVKPTDLTLSIGECLFLPSTKNYKEDWKGRDIQSPDLIFCHQTFDGAKAENGQELPGIPPSYFAKAKKVYSGDIHVPQKLTKIIEYVGAPYRVHFGDRFDGRALMLSGWGREHKVKDLHFPAKPRELLEITSLADMQKAKFEMGAQVKVRAHLLRREYPDWATMRQEIKALAARRGWELFGPELAPIKGSSRPEKVEEAEQEDNNSHAELIAGYALEKKLSKEAKAQGLSYLEE